MDEFKPSVNFSARIMAEVHSYEMELNQKKNLLDGLLHSKLVLSALSATGILFGILNFIRLASILISPALCL
jgi:hypothetical protein